MTVPIIARRPGSATDATGAPGTGVTDTDDPRREALDGVLGRLQARDDGGFITAGLAGLAARQSRALGTAMAETTKPERLDALIVDGVPAFARDFTKGFERDVDDMVSRAQARPGLKPSAEALDLFRRRSAGIGERLFTRAALHEDSLNRIALTQSGTQAMDDLAAMVAADPDTLDEANEQLGPAIAAQGAVLGADSGENLKREQPRRLAEAALGAFIGRDPADAMARIDSGAFDERLDDDTRARLRERAETRKSAMDADRETAARRAEAEAMRTNERAALAFTRGFRRRLESGEATLAELADGTAAGTISPAQNDRLRAEFDRAAANREADDVEIARVTQSLTEGKLLDPTSDDDRRAVDLHCRAVLDPNGDFGEEFKDYVADTGIAPEPGLDRLLGALIAGAPAAQMQAAGTLLDVLEIDPAARDLVRLPLIGRAERLKKFEVFGLPAEQVVEIVDSEERVPARPTLLSAEGGGGDGGTEAGKTDQGSPPPKPGSGDDAEPEGDGDDGDDEPDFEPGDDPPLETESGDKPGGLTGDNGPRDDGRDPTFNRFRKSLKGWEGGFADRPESADRGGPTKEGISQKLLNNLNRLHPEWGLPKQSKDLTAEQITGIYRSEFFDKPRIGGVVKIPGLKEQAPRLTEQLFDSGVLHSTKRAGEWLQKSLDKELGTDLRETDKTGRRAYDGIVGSKTRAALARAVREGKAAVINDAMVKRRVEFMRQQPELRFNSGWIPRANSFLTGAPK
jgi:lysozyme family protein